MDMLPPAAPSPPFSQSQNDYDFSQTQRDPVVRPDEDVGMEGESQVQNSQVNPRRKYWAVFTPLSPDLQPIKLFWPTVPAPPTNPTSSSSTRQQELPGASGKARIGRGPYLKFNDIVLPHRRVSNRHCVIGRFQETGRVGGGASEPIVYIEDLGSSNGTWVNGRRIQPTPYRQVLTHGDEVSLGAQGQMEDHDVRYIFRSVGKEGEPPEPVGGIFERYFFRETLGKGTFAEVKKAVEISTGMVRAVKCITRHRFASNPRTLQLFEREVHILRSLSHENICQLIEVFDDPQHIYLVLEYVDGGDLLEYVMKRADDPGPGLSEQETIQFTTQICRAMAYTHSLGVAHRDLKPENILLTSDNPPVIKVADFGLAKMVDEGTALRTMVGTPQYLAPEVVMQTPARPGYEMVVDSWSVGVIVYCMMTNAMPFDEDPNDPVAVRIQKRLEQPFDYDLLRQIGVSDLGVNFIECLLAKDPAKRMTLTDALRHPWLEGEGRGDSLGESFDDGSFGAMAAYRRHQTSNSIDAQSHASTVHGATDGLDGVGETPQMEGMMEGSSVEDFSYPMHNLHLHTPASRTAPSAGSTSMMSLTGGQAELAGQSSFFGGPRQENESGDISMRMIAPISKAIEQEEVGDSQPDRPQAEAPHSVLLQQSPPTPPYTDATPAVEAAEGPEVDPTPAPAPADLDVRVMDYAGRMPDVAGTTSGPSSTVGTGLKRKLSNQSDDRTRRSSSSLSSVPPEDDMISTPKRTAAAVKVMVRTTPSRRKRSTVNMEAPPPGPTRTSARLAAKAGVGSSSPASARSLRKKGKK